jgi:Bifunctional DNA primase/polymerase, N-terminal
VLPLHSVTRGRCTCGQPGCSSPGKHPRVRNGLHDATTNAEQLRSWWSRWPNSNVGVATGAVSGFFVLDVDRLEALDELHHEHGVLPETLTQRTGSGGVHFLFGYPAEAQIGNRTGLLKGVDLRASGGYIVTPPSLHVSAHRYTWTSQKPLSPAPPWLIELAKTRPKPVRRAAPPAHYAGEDVLGTPWGRAVLEGEIEELMGSTVGQRNHALFRSACAVFSAAKAGELAMDMARRCLHHAALMVGLGALEITKTLDSAQRRSEPRAPESRPA